MSVINCNRINEFAIADFSFWKIYVNPKQLAFGSLLILLKRDCLTIRDLRQEEFNELMFIFSRTEIMLEAAFNYDTISYRSSVSAQNKLEIVVLPSYEKPIQFNGIKFDNTSSIKNEMSCVDIKEEALNHVLRTLQDLSFKKIVGYSTGVFDLFHVGHLNILEQAKRNCDFHIVGVTTDEEVLRIKGSTPVIPYEERARIVAALTCVDQVIPEANVDKLKSWEKTKFDIIFKGDDWKGTEKWSKLEKEFFKRGVEVKYFPYTTGTSSTHLKSVLAKILNEK